jgi:hypothetical protein
VRCGRCGNDNAETNRFCGMCGAALVAKTQPAGQPGVPVTASAGNTAVPRPPAVPVQPAAPPPAKLSELPGPSDAPARPRPSPTSVSHTAPVITGPSFLGLNTPAPGPREDRVDSVTDFTARKDSDGQDPLRRSSRSVEYLLDDEEEPKRGWGKLLVVVIALALAVGFGYLHWKQGGFDWLTAGDKKPSATTQTPESPQSATDSGAGTTATATPDAAASGPATPQPASGTTPAMGDSTAAGSSAQQATPAQTAAPENTSPPQPSPATSNPPADSASPPADADSSTQSPPPPTPAPKLRERKPTPAKPVDPVTEAERYIYGRGVRQDCDRGIRLLKPAADQSNPKAMISLGALYSTGTCAPRDLPTAYRWFALALHKQPDNQPLQDDLQKLWSQMTQPERQLAIKLSQ